MHRVLVVGVMMVASVAGVAAQETAQRLFEAGQYDQALQRIAEQRREEASSPADAYLAGQMLSKLHRDEEAKHEYQSLADSGDPTWALVGQSALAASGEDNRRALDLATKAATSAPASFHAQYQLGHARSQFDDWAGCAEAFDRAAAIDPSFAYAHYYAGLSFSRIKRADKTSEHMERFLKLAPSAPERPAVESLMRTLRGR